MKRYLLSAAALCFAMAMSAQSLFVGSYNIRYHNSDDDRNGNVWKTRCKVICDQVNFESPDIFGAQEVLHAQLGDLLGALDGYDYIGVGRDNGKTKGEYAAIFYKKDRVKLLNKGNFWLNETPDKPKLGWDAACIRICSWGEFEQAETGFRFYYFNLHMDHVGVVARREAAKLVVKKIGEIAKGAPVVLTGDFNVDQNDEIYRIFTSSRRSTTATRPSAWSTPTGTIYRASSTTISRTRSRTATSPSTPRHRLSNPPSTVRSCPRP